MASLTRWVLIVVLLGLAVQARAGLTVSPGIGARLEYNDNIYLEPDHEESDFIATVTPTLRLDWQTPRVDMALDARLELQKYFDNSNEDRIGPGEGDQGTTFTMLARLYQEHLFLRVTDTYQRVPIDEGARRGEDNLLVNMTDSNRLAVNPYLQFEPADGTQVRVGYTYENLWYGNENGDGTPYARRAGDDAESHVSTLTLTEELSPRVTFTLEGVHLAYRPRDAADTYVVGEDGTYDYDRDTARASLKYQMTERLLLNVGYGHSWLDYEVRDDVDADVWEISADYEITSALKASIAYSRDYYVTVEDGPSERDRYSASIAYEKRITSKATVFTSSDDYVEIDREDDAWGCDLEGVLPFTDRAGLEGLLRYSSYSRSGLGTEDYDRYGLRLGYYHEISRARLSLGYIWNREGSDLDANDYNNNIVYAAANFTF